MSRSAGAGVPVLRIGTRGSVLARWQASWVGERLVALFPELRIQLVTVKTLGDKILDVPLAQMGGKGLFVKEIEDALLEGRVDLAVHSVKDLPVETPQGLQITAIPEREDPRDALLSARGEALDHLPRNSRVGTSSLRRRAQLLHRRADLQVVNLRGNVDTRIRKWDAGEVEAILLAVAGIRRLGYETKITEILEADGFLPAVGQGALGIETREGDESVNRWVRRLDHGPSRTCVEAERAFLRELHGGCQVPIGALGNIVQGVLRLQGMVAGVDGSPMVRAEIRGPATQADRLGVELAREMLARGAREILDELYSENEPEVDLP
jgi:hydroxymethylbilane synthase